MNLLRNVKIVLALIVFTQGVSANGWERWGSSDNADWYVLRESAERSGNKVNVWFLKDLKKPDSFRGVPYNSRKELYTLDCKEHTSYVSSFVFLSGKGGAGSQVYSSTTGYGGAVEKYAPDDWKREWEEFCVRAWEFWKK